MDCRTVPAVKERRAAVVNMIVMGLALVFFAVLLQYSLFRLARKRVVLAVVPIFSAPPVLYLLIRYADVSILDPKSEVFFGAVFLGIPFVLGSLIGGIVIAAKNRVASSV